MKKKKILNERGQMLPFIAFMIVILILFSAFSIGTTMMFMQRKAVEDALDAAILSVAMASVEEKQRATYYYDYVNWICTAYAWTLWGPVCVGGYYRVGEDERYYNNYIYVNENAETVLEEAFLRNLEKNSHKAVVKELDLEIEYDDERFLLVRKYKDYLDPPGTLYGWPLVGRSYNPESWWKNEFSGSIGFMNEPENFTMEIREDRIVRFPRWVKLTATATVEVPSVMGGILVPGGNTTEVTVTVSAVRELIEVSRPRLSW